MTKEWFFDSGFFPVKEQLRGKIYEKLQEKTI